MKVVVIVLVFSLCSCVFTAKVRESGFLTHQEAVVLIDNINDCLVKELISTSGDNRAQNNDDKLMSGILRLKAVAKERGYNAISNVKLESFSNPNGEAQALVCSASKKDEYRRFQSDLGWLRNHVSVLNQ